MTVSETTDATFSADVLESDQPVLVDFTAAWCGPCRMIAPILAQIDTEDDRLKIVSLDVDANPETTRDYGVMGMPTMALFIDGKIVKTIVGARPKSAILRELDPHL